MAHGLPIISGDAFFYFSNPSDIPLFGPAIYALQSDKERLENRCTVRFWNLLTLALL